VKISEITIHNFRSLKHVTLALGDYSLLVGQNNTGKTGVLTALRCFYEEGGAKYTPDLDFPKFSVDDNESWVEVHFLTTDEEQEELKREYRSKDSALRVRRYFKSDNKELVKANQSNIYAYEHGVLSSNLFYGAKNVSQAKVGSAIYIPEVSRTDETLKLSGPSPLREMINFVMKRAVSDSKSFSDLQGAIGKFDEDFRKEASEDGFSVKSLIAKINENLSHWRIRFGVDINPLRPEDIVKSLLSHYIEDDNLDGKRVNISSYGQGLQRELIYTLIRLSTVFVAPRKEKKKDFDPDLTLILFEEPEAFLHPSQQDRLNASLRSLAAETGQQALITTHSPQFVSRQVRDLTSITRLEKPAKETLHFQLLKADIDNLLDENLGLYKKFSDMLKNATVSEALKTNIRNRKLGEATPDDEAKLQEEAMHFLLWLNAERAISFFAKHIVICEGLTEKVLLDYLVNQNWPDLRERSIYFLDALGKFSIHRFIAVFSSLGIRHSVLMDRDKNTDIHKLVNDFISEKQTKFTTGIHCFDQDLEEFLGIPKAARPDLKPLHVVCCLRGGKIGADKITALKQVLDDVMGN